jgi:hypothetical protein
MNNFIGNATRVIDEMLNELLKEKEVTLKPPKRTS